MKKPLDELHPHIVRKIDAGEQLDLIVNPPHDGMVRVVDFFSTTVRQVYSNNKYTIMLSDAIGPSPVSCLFLNHKDHRKQVISSSNYMYLSSFNKALNAAFESSLSETDSVGTYKLCVCYGQHVYKCKDISGTIYIIWALYVNCTNAGNVARSIYKNVPILFNFDGQARLKGVYILKAQVQGESDLLRIPITLNDPVLLFSKKSPFFVCEVRVTYPGEGQSSSGIQTLSYSDAVNCASSLSGETVSIIKSLPNHFASSIDVEEDYYDGGNHSITTVTQKPDQGSPRAVLFLQDVNIHRDSQVTPPIVASDCEDPFK